MYQKQALADQLLPAVAVPWKIPLTILDWGATAWVTAKYRTLTQGCLQLNG